jgi:hypothetical protein
MERQPNRAPACVGALAYGGDMKHTDAGLRRLNGERLRAGLDRLGLSPGMAAERWYTPLAVVQDWLRGKLPIHGPVWRLLEIEQPIAPMQLPDSSGLAEDKRQI